MRRLGYIPSPPDKVGDGHPLALLGAAPLDLPDSAAVDMPDPLDQTDEDCTANAVALAIQAEMGRRPDGTWHPLASRRFFYALSRERAKIPLTQNEGSFIWSTMEIARDVGFPDEAAWPYTADRLAIPPDPAAYQAAADQKMVDGVYRMASTDDALLLDELKSIASGAVVPCGYMIDRAFMNAQAGTVWDGPVGIVGGHAVVLCAFRGVRNGSDISQVEIAAQSSWTKDFGDGGKIWMTGRAAKAALDAWRVTVKVPSGFSSEVAA